MVWCSQRGDGQDMLCRLGRGPYGQLTFFLVFWWWIPAYNIPSSDTMYFHTIMHAPLQDTKPEALPTLGPH